MGPYFFLIWTTSIAFCILWEARRTCCPVAAACMPCSCAGAHQSASAIQISMPFADCPCRLCDNFRDVPAQAHIYSIALFIVHT